jgi:AraC family transcriptional regulator
VRIVETWHQPGTRLGAHEHDHAAITVVLSGVVQESVGGRPFVLHPGHVLAKPPKIAHANAYGDDGARSLIVEFPAPISADSVWYEAADASGAATIRAMQMYDAFRSSSTATPLLAEELAAELSRAVPARRVADSPRWVQRVRERIHTEFAPPPALRALALEHGVHPVSLARAFARAFGCSIGQYARRRQLETVVEQLRLGTPPSLAALNAGFYDQSHLGRILRREFGCTPRWLASALSGGF